MPLRFVMKNETDNVDGISLGGGQQKLQGKNAWWYREDMCNWIAGRQGVSGVIGVFGARVS